MNPLSVLLAIDQSSLNPAGRQAGLISQLWWVYFAVTGAVYLIVMGVMLWIAWRTPRQASDQHHAQTVLNPATESRLTRVISTSIGCTTIILLILMISDFITARRYHALAASSDMHLKILARQWWWEVQYVDDATPSNSLVTANEIVLPVNKTVRVDLEGRDVIHSFWIPNLAGKKDAIPGHPTSVWLRADQTGDYESQCAEFCGLEHAKMRLGVKVAQPGDFEQWYKHQQSEAAEPQTDQQKRGKTVFLSSTCTICHTVAGTSARGMVGPDLTHIGNRPTLAAGSLANTPENLSNWIKDPQSIKPGVRMPQHNLPPEDLSALVDYLENLK